MAAYQAVSAAANVTTLALHCRRRYLHSADLVGVRSAEIERLREFGWKAGIDVAPLMPAWQGLCSRYVNERYDGQSGLFDKYGSSQQEAWCHFVNWTLFSHLLREDEFVRNVLRALGASACTSRHAAADGIHRHLMEMPLPAAAARYDAEDMTRW